jgi:hypothetical protein
MRRDLTREEMITLVGRICRAEGTEDEMTADIALFQANCKHPSGTDLIFWPTGFPHDPAKPESTVEEIVDKAMDGSTRRVFAMPPQNTDG